MFEVIIFVRNVIQLTSLIIGFIRLVAFYTKKNLLIKNQKYSFKLLVNVS